MIACNTSLGEGCNLYDLKIKFTLYISLKNNKPVKHAVFDLAVANQTSYVFVFV